MNVAVKLGAAACAVLASACTLNPLSKDACNTASDCLGGYVCVSNHCVPAGGGGTAGGGNGGGNGGNVGTSDGGRDAPPPSMCPATAVTACPPADSGAVCEETFCGGRLWQNGLMKSVLINYRIKDPQSMFSPSYRGAIRAAATAWNRVSAGFVTLQECTSCAGHYVSVVPGDGDGITPPDTGSGEQTLPMPVVGGGGRVSPHRIAHQWGHVVGLSHTYQRADRDRYVRFDPAIWCAPGGSGLPPRCAADPTRQAPGLPAVTGGTFGVFDGKSKMNGFHSEGICGAEEPDEDSSEPTIGDVSAAAELFFGVTASGWSPFRPIGRSVSPTEPLDYQLAPGVDPMGSPAIAEPEVIQVASPEIFVRGTDDRVYTTSLRDPSTADWLDWTVIAEDADADPAVVFAVNGVPKTLFLAVRSRLDGSIQLRARRGATWGAWTSLEAPPSGAASAPALASESPNSLAAVVRGGDGLIYWLHCMDADQDCAASAAGASAWKALPAPSSGIFVGKPSAVWPLTSPGLTVAAIRDDRVALVIKNVDSAISDWGPAGNINADLAPDDPDPGVAITLSLTPDDITFFARNQQGLLVSDTQQLKFPSIGGVLASPPGAVAVYQISIRTDVAAIIDDHGRPGVWWRFNDANYVAPCNYNQPGMCARCGL